MQSTIHTQTPAPAAAPPAGRPAWYDTKRIAWEMSVSVNTVKSWLAQGRMPPPDIRGHRFNRWKDKTITPFLADPSVWLAKKGA